jgi:hypothetical protein
MALATAPWGRGVVFDGTDLDVDAMIIFEEGYSVGWFGVDPLPADGLTSITPLLTEEGFVVGRTADLVRDGVMAQLLYSAGAGQTWVLRWDGTQFNVTLGADVETSEAHKVTNLDAAWPLDDDVAATSIGYGGTGVTTGTEIVLTALGAVWHHTTGAGWVNKTGNLPAGWTWRWIETNPLNPDDWFAFGSLGTSVDGGTMTSDGQPSLWRTLNAGATWAGVSLTALSAIWIEEIASPPIGYTSNNEVFFATTLRGYNGADYPTIWRGTTGPLPIVHQTTVNPNSNNILHSAIAGIGGDIVFVEDNYALGSFFRHLYVLAPGGGTATSIGFAGNGEYGTITRLDRFGRGILWRSDGSGRERRSFATYTSSTSTAWAAFDGYDYLPAGITEGYVMQTPPNEITVRNADGTVIRTRINAVPLGNVVSDPQTRDAVATVAGSAPTDVWFSDNRGASWASFALPSGVTPINFGVIVRQ